jgi:hypothetical protein
LELHDLIRIRIHPRQQQRIARAQEKRKGKREATYDSPMEVDGESSYKSWPWWLDALQAMRMTYSIPMDAKEARIRADVAEAKRKETAEETRKETAAAPGSEALRKRRLARWIGRTQDPKALRDRAAAEEARGEDWLVDEMKVVNRWGKTKDPEAATYLRQLGEEQMEMHLRMDREEKHVQNDDDVWDDDKKARWACEYRSKWKSVHARYTGSTYDDISKYFLCLELLCILSLVKVKF